MAGDDWVIGDLVTVFKPTIIPETSYQFGGGEAVSAARENMMGFGQVFRIVSIQLPLVVLLQVFSSSYMGGSKVEIWDTTRHNFMKVKPEFALALGIQVSTINIEGVKKFSVSPEMVLK